MGCSPMKKDDIQRLEDKNEKKSKSKIKIKFRLR